MRRMYEGSVSWVQMELYHLGELPGAEADRITAYLDASPSPDFMDIYIQNDSRPMPPLGVDEILEVRPTNWSRYGKPAMVLAAASVTLLMVLFWPDSKPIDPGRRESAVQIKGGEMVLSVTRNRNGLLTEHPETYKDGDRFKVSLTSSIEETLWVEVMIYQGDDIYFPYDDLVDVTGGNRETLPGTIQLTSGGMTRICILAADPMPPRTAIRELETSSDLGNIACVSLSDRTGKE